MPKQRSKKKAITEPLCQGCPNKTIKYIDNGKEKEMPCQGLCPPMIWIDGNKQTQEALMSDINGKDLEYRDYKDDLIEMIEHRQARIDTAINITDVKHRAISILLLAGLTQKDIATLFCMSYRQINRIANKII